jgi:transposase
VSPMSLLKLFCDVDDFCNASNDFWQTRSLGSGCGKKRGPKPALALSEVMTIIIHFHQSHYRHFKAYYTDHVGLYLRAEFPRLPSYNRFVELMPGALLPLCLYLQSRLAGPTGIAFIDATPLPVCHNRRIQRHKLFAGLAARGKSSVGWFYGFKLHLVVNERGELVALSVTPGNVDDRKPVPHLTKALWGKLFGDKGYISQALFDELFARGLQLITSIRKNMKPRLVPLMDKLLLRKRAIIETINDQLKNISQIAHTRHRSIDNFMVNLMAGLIAYTWQPRKPSLNLVNEDAPLLPVLI